MAAAEEPRRYSSRALFIAGGAIGVGALTALAVVAARPPAAEHVGPLRPRMLLLPGGMWLPGTATSARTTRLAVAETEVTQDQWTAVMDSNPSWFTAERGGSSDAPVERINFYDAVEYLNRLSKREGLSECYAIIDPQGGMAGAGCGEVPDCTDGFRGNGVELRPACALGQVKAGYRLPTESAWRQMGVDLPSPTLTSTTPIVAVSLSPTARVLETSLDSSGLRGVRTNVFEWGVLDSPRNLHRLDMASMACGPWGGGHFCRATDSFFVLPIQRSARFGLRPVRWIHISELPSGSRSTNL